MQESVCAHTSDRCSLSSHMLLSNFGNSITGILSLSLIFHSAGTINRNWNQNGYHGQTARSSGN